VAGDPTYRFGDFVLDLRRHELRLGSDQHALQPRVFALLRYLVENPLRAISREELLAEVWTGVAVTDASLTKAVRALRACLGRDPAVSGALETVRGRGYRFRASVETVGDGRRAGRSDGLARPLFGRDAELGRLAALAQAVRDGGRRFVLIAGDPGTGKTALVQRTLDVATAGFSVGEGQSLEGFGEQTPYLPILEAIAGFASADGNARRSHVCAIVRRAAPSWRGHLPALFPDDGPELLPLARPPEQMGRELLDTIELIGRERPAVLVVEDVHWADRSTLSLLHAIARRSVPSRLLVLCTVRSAELEASEPLRALRADVVRSPSSLVLETPPIGVDAVREYALWTLERGGVARGASTDRFVDWLHARTGGHPLFLTELTDHLAALGLVAAAQSTPFPADRLDAAGIPATLGQLIRQWVTQLTPLDRAFLEAASAAGFQFDLRLAQAALGVDEGTAEASVDRLCQAGWIRHRDFDVWADGSRAARFRFEHVLFREALDAGIPPSRRARFHQAIAQRLETGNPGDPTCASELAAHFELAGMLAEATRQRVAAASRAASIQSHDEALHHAERGLGLLDALPPAERRTAEVDLRLAVGLALAARSGFGDEDAMEAFLRARNLATEAGDVAREVAAIWGIASCNKVRGELEATREDGERLLALAESTNEERYRLLALDLLCSVAFFQGRFEDCLALKQRADAAALGRAGHRGDVLLARSLEDTRVTAQVYGAIALWHLGDARTMVDLIREARARPRSPHLPYTTATVEVFGSTSSHIVGDRVAQRGHAVRARTVCERHGIALWAEIARFMEIHAAPATAETLAALRDTLRAMARCGGLGGTLFIEMLADRELDFGHAEAAQRLCRLGIERAERTTEAHHLPMLYATAARAAADEAERARLFETAAACAIRTGSIALAARIEAARATDAAARPASRA